MSWHTKVYCSIAVVLSGMKPTQSVVVLCEQTRVGKEVQPYLALTPIAHQCMSVVSVSFHLQWEFLHGPELCSLGLCFKAFFWEKIPSKDCYSSLHALTKITKHFYVRNKTLWAWTVFSCSVTALVMTGEAIRSCHLIRG